MQDKKRPVSDESRCRGAIYGLFIGDALAMPVHRYYDTLALRRDYGHVTDYVVPMSPHPDSILWRSSYHPRNERGHILHTTRPNSGANGASITTSSWRLGRTR
jgi:ADP-ribosyl-[dinitrogen reductase] hydrolase